MVGCLYRMCFVKGALRPLATIAHSPRLVGVRRQREMHRHPPRAAARAFQTIPEQRDREVRTSRPDQRHDIELVAVAAFPDRLQPVPLAPCAAYIDAGAVGPQIANGLHFCHWNRLGTFALRRSRPDDMLGPCRGARPRRPTLPVCLIGSPTRMASKKIAIHHFFLLPNR